MAAPVPYDYVPKRIQLKITAGQVRLNYMQNIAQLHAAVLDPATINVKNARQLLTQAQLFDANLALPFGKDQFPPLWKRALWHAFEPNGETSAWADEDAMVTDLVSVRDAMLALVPVIVANTPKTAATFEYPDALEADGSASLKEVVQTLDKAQNQALLDAFATARLAYGDDPKV